MEAAVVVNESLHRELIQTLPPAPLGTATTTTAAAAAGATTSSRGGNSNHPNTHPTHHNGHHSYNPHDKASVASLRSTQMASAKRAQTARREARRVAYEAELARQREVQARRIEAERERRDREFETRLRAFDDGEAFVKDVEAALTEAAEVRRHKAEKLHREWHRDVYEVIQAEVDATSGDPAAKEAKRRAFESYLEASSSKRGVFRDVVIEGDYDPFTTRKVGGVYHPSRVRDPIKRDLVKRAEEERLIAEAEGKQVPRDGSGVEPGRKTLDTKFWDKLESTPYSERSVKQREEPRLKKSSIVMDHYNPVTESEVPRERRGKRAVVREPNPERERIGKKIFPEKWRTNVISHEGPPPPNNE